MGQELPSLGETEIEVLRLIWREQPCTERQISDLILQERSVARTTVLKTMQRLEAKGVLERVPGEGPVQFRAALEEKRVLPELVQRFVNRVLGGASNPLVKYLADSKNLSREDVKTLQEIATRIDRQND